MACFHPLRAYRKRPGGPAYVKPRTVTFDLREGYADLQVLIPCGQCVGCRLERSRQWAVRCMHEASLYESNCFITLTFDDEHLPPFGSLAKHELCETLDRCVCFGGFMKRLREKYNECGIRFYHCGEYGASTARPHYHSCIFGFDFPDKEPWSSRHGFPTWRSVALEKLWPFGQSEIGSVTFESAAYVARYMLKKADSMASDPLRLVDEDTGVLEPVLPEYTTMSRRPGIGRPWLDKYMCEVYPSDGVVMRGRLMKPPRYYDLQFELLNGAQSLEVARSRRRKARARDMTPERLAVREQVTRARIALSQRSL